QLRRCGRGTPAPTAPARRRSAGVADDRADVWRLATPNLAHDLAHLVELLDEPVDLLHVGARPARDPQPSRALDQLGPAALLGGHRKDDCLDPVELAFVDLEVLELVAAEAGDHPQDAAEGAEF